MKKQTTKANTDSQNIMDRIDSLQAALDYKGETMEQFNKRTEHDSDAEKADKEAAVIAFALREGRDLKPGERMWAPYFYGSGSGFSFYDSYYAYDYSSVGARRSVDTKEKSDYMGKQFKDIHQRIMHGK